MWLIQVADELTTDTYILGYSNTPLSDAELDRLKHYHSTKEWELDSPFYCKREEKCEYNECTEASSCNPHDWTCSQEEVEHIDKYA
jgi:hypothetical protein